MTNEISLSFILNCPENNFADLIVRSLSYRTHAGLYLFKANFSILQILHIINGIETNRMFDLLVTV